MSETWMYKRDRSNKQKVKSHCPLFSTDLDNDDVQTGVNAVHLAVRAYAHTLRCKCEGRQCTLLCVHILLDVSVKADSVPYCAQACRGNQEHFIAVRHFRV